jgi:hypothetical protein
MATRTARRSGYRAKARGHQAARSKPLKGLARAGFVARGVMYVLIGWIALMIAFGNAPASADNRGALEIVGSTTVGRFALWLLAIGFAGLALWRLTEAAFGGPEASEHKVGERLLVLFKACVYTFLSYSTFRFALGSGAPKSSNSQSADLTATLLKYPGGQIAVVIVGLVLIGAGGYLIWQAWQRAFLKTLQTGQMTTRQRQLANWLGLIGGIARGLVFAGVGVFFIVAGAEHNPGKAKGIDATLRSFAHTPLGPLLLVLVAIGLVIFGCYSFVEARWRRI